MLIGSHVSFGSEQLLGSAKEAVSYGASTFMFYTGAPQNTIRKEIHPDLLKNAHEYIQENGIDLNHVICHAPYIVNLANRKEEEKWQFSVTFLKNELKRCEDMGVKYMVLHPGSA
ncbi:MAG: TIM barrel protein, partial [Bacilli bacterium]|nr:TIM barrel protein [Bacilli bacterium]